MKRLTSIFLVLAMILTLAPVNIFATDAQTPVFSDIQDTDYYAKAATALEQLDILKGYPDGTFGAEKPITRAEMAAVVCRMIDKEADSENAKGETIFSDVKATDWESGYVNIAVAEKIINGYPDGTFKPDANIKHEEAIKMVVCAMGYGDEVVMDAKDWSKGYLELADKKGISSDLNGEKGKASTRGDVAVMSYASIQVAEAEAKAASIANGTPVASVASGTYTSTQKVTLSSAVEGATIYYTTNGSEPTTKSTKYTKAITISKTTTLKAIAVKDGEVLGDVMSVVYTMDIKTPVGGGGGGGGSYTPPAPTTYTVSFDLNYEGATGAPASQTVNSGEKATEPPVPDRAGYSFSGWYKESECSNLFNFNTESISSTIVLYAKWEDSTAKIELSVNEENIFTNNDSEITYFYAELINYSGDVDVLGLYDDKNELVATMYDDGQYSENGDELSNDNIYTCALVINEEEETILNYIAKIQNTSNIASDTLAIKVIEAITETQIANMNIVDNAINEGIFELQNYETMSIEERKEVTENKLEELEENGLIVENTIIYDENSSTYTFEYESGALGAVIIGEWNENQNGIQNTRESFSKDEISVFSTINKATEIAENDEIQVVSDSSGSDLNAVILWSFNQAWDNDSYRRPFYQSTEADWESAGVDTDVIWDTIVEDYKKLDDYEIIVFSGHGAYTGYKPSSFSEKKYMSSLLLHEKATQEKDNFYKNDLKLYRIGKIQVNGGTMYAILPNFWSYYYKDGDLDGSFIFAENCEFHGKNGDVHKDMSNALTNLSAEAVIGFHNSVMADYSRELMKEYIDKLIDGGLSSTAFNNAKTIHGENDYFAGRENIGPTAYPIFCGNESASLVETDFDNGSFEEGISQGGWKKQGDVRAISKLGDLVPIHGSRLALITTGIGSGESHYEEATEGSLLYQTFKVLSGAKTLSFVYNVVSEEPMEYVGSQFDDKFKVEIKCEGQTSLISEDSVNQAGWHPIDNIDFDGGDTTTYHTRWKKVNYDISDYQNKTVTLRFIVYDVGDSIYDTAALVDNITITSSEYDAPRHAPNMYANWVGNEKFDAVSVDWKCVDDAENTYWAIHNWNNGYAGFQNRDGQHVLLLSLWDLSDGTTPTVEFALDGQSGEFGGEGTGKQVFTNYDWEKDKWYSMKIEVELTDNKIIFSQWIKEFYGEWLKTAAISYPAMNFSFDKVSAFQEDFTFNSLDRSCMLANAQGKSILTGDWVHLEKCEISSSFFPTEDATWENGVIMNTTNYCDWYSTESIVCLISGKTSLSLNGTLPTVYSLIPADLSEDYNNEWEDTILE